MALNVVRRIERYNQGRDPERLAMKYRAMRASPFAFLRGSCHLFYERLPRGGIFDTAPPVWTCGDLHLENFGSYRADNRLAYFDINDFDEATLAPASWDLVRLLTSLRIGTGPAPERERESAVSCQALLDAYAQALSEGKAYWLERETARGWVRQLLDQVKTRQRPAFLDTRTVLRRGRRRLRIDGRRALPATPAQREAVDAFMHRFALGRPDADFFEVLDVARRIAGTGSLGVDRFAVLVRGKGSPDGNYLLDLKQALPSSLHPSARIDGPSWKDEAQRIVAVQRRMQAVSMAFLEPVRVDGRPFVLRALQASEDRVRLDAAHRDGPDWLQFVGDMGRLLAWAQLRSAGREGSAIADELIAFARRKKWKAALLDASHDAAVQVRSDAATFDAAWDDGAFDA